MKIIKIISISLLVLLCSNICFASTGIVNTPAVRIREKASTDSKIVIKAYEDDEIEILGEEGDWYKVKFEGKEGYASKSLIKEKGSSSNKNETTNDSATNTSTTNTSANTINTNTSNTSNNTTTDTNTPTANNTVSNNDTSSSSTSSEENNTINGDTVVRVMPNFASNEVRLLAKDTKVEVLRELNNWCEISLENTNGWILKNKVNNETVQTSTEPQTPPETNTVPAENTVSDNTSTQNTVTNESKNNMVANNTSTSNTNTSSTNTATTNTTASNSSTTTDNSRNGKGKINVETANVRAKASKNSAILNCLDIGDEVTIVAEEGDWYKITSSKVESGYVSKALVTVSDVSNRSAVREEAKSEESVTEELAIIATTKGTDVVSFAKQYLGCSYVLGGKTPDSGFDCSGYTRYVFKNFGYSLGTVAAEQNSLGREVDRSDLQEGDLILFYNEQKTKIGHTGIYIGGNEFIHAANPDRGVVTDNLQTNSYYSERFVTARRIVE